MGAVRWTDMKPMNNAPLYSALTRASANIGNAGEGIQKAITDFSENKTEAETADFVNSLMQADNQAQRDNLISLANPSWLDMSTVNATNYELGQPERDLAITLDEEKRAAELWEDQLKKTQAAEKTAYNEQKATDLIFNQKMEDEIYSKRAEVLAAAKLAEFNAKQEAEKNSDLKDLYKNYGDDPTAFLKNKYGFAEGGMFNQINPFGPAMGQNNLDSLTNWARQFGSNFASKGYDIKDFNDFVVRGGITFEDAAPVDQWVFTNPVTNEKVELGSYNDNTAELLQQAILASKGKFDMDTASEGSAFGEVYDAAKSKFPDLLKQIDNPDTKENEFMSFFQSLEPSQRTSSALTKELLETYIKNNDDDDDNDVITASNAVQSEVRSILQSMPNEVDKIAKLGELILIPVEDRTETQKELFRQLEIATRK
jgi:hypothetical protein